MIRLCPSENQHPRDLGLEIQKNNVGLRISILEITGVLMFRQNRQLWFFRSRFAQKWILRLEFQKSNSRFEINTLKTPCVLIFNQNGQLWIFRPKLGKLLNYVQYFCGGCCREPSGSLNELSGGGWSWMGLGWCGWTWVQVNGAGWRWVRGLAKNIYHKSS